MTKHQEFAVRQERPFMEKTILIFLGEEIFNGGYGMAQKATDCIVVKIV